MERTEKQTRENTRIEDNTDNTHKKKTSENVQRKEKQREFR